MPRLSFFGFQKVVERFHRNPSIQINKDVAQRVFLVPEMKTELIYHLIDHRTIPSRKSLKRIEDDEPITDSMFSTFLVRLNLQLRTFLRRLPVTGTSNIQMFMRPSKRSNSQHGGLTEGNIGAGVFY